MQSFICQEMEEFRLNQRGQVDPGINLCLVLPKFLQPGLIEIIQTFIPTTNAIWGNCVRLDEVCSSLGSQLLPPN